MAVVATNSLWPASVRDIDVQVAQQIVAYERSSNGLTADAEPILFHAALMLNMALGQGQVCWHLGNCLLEPMAAQWQSWGLEHIQQVLKQCHTVYQPSAHAEYQQQPLVLVGERLYIARYYFYEISVLHQIKQRLTPLNTEQDAQLTAILARLFPASESIDWQKIAAATACVQPFSIITGGPGTGKTTTVTKLLSALLELNPQLNIALAAPTGKAAARMTESIRNAKTRDESLKNASAIPDASFTLHRLLGWSPRGFRYNKQHPLPYDCVVVDEASMVDLPMMQHLFAALAPQARLILLGDRDQLASVEAGSVLADLCDAGTEHGLATDFAQRISQLSGCDLSAYQEAFISPMQNAVATLRFSHRFNANSGIGQLAAAVNNSDALAASKAWLNFTDIEFSAINSQDQQRYWYHSRWQAVVVEGFREFCTELNKETGNDEKASAVFKAFNQFQVLVALREGIYGVEQVNQQIERLLRNKLGLAGDEKSVWYVGRPVMITRNDYDLGLFNGDIGIAMDFHDGDKKIIKVAFPGADGSMRWLLPTRLPSHETAFAMTVHKSQGSEFINVCLLLPEQWQAVITRELIYTAITRARQRFYLFSSESCWMQGLSSRVQRASGLRDALWLSS